MLYKRLKWLKKISFTDSGRHHWPEKSIEGGGSMPKVLKNSRWSWKKVTTFGENIHLEKFQPYIMAMQNWLLRHLIWCNRKYFTKMWTHTCVQEDKGTATAPDRPQLTISSTRCHPGVIVLTPQGTGQHLWHLTQCVIVLTLQVNITTFISCINRFICSAHGPAAQVRLC